MRNRTRDARGGFILLVDNWLSHRTNYRSGWGSTEAINGKLLSLSNNPNHKGQLLSVWRLALTNQLCSKTFHNKINENVNGSRRVEFVKQCFRFLWLLLQARCLHSLVNVVINLCYLNDDVGLMHWQQKRSFLVDSLVCHCRECELETVAVVFKSINFTSRFCFGRLVDSLCSMGFLSFSLFVLFRNSIHAPNGISINFDFLS